MTEVFCPQRIIEPPEPYNLPVASVQRQVDASCKNTTTSAWLDSTRDKWDGYSSFGCMDPFQPPMEGAPAATTSVLVLVCHSRSICNNEHVSLGSFVQSSSMFGCSFQEDKLTAAQDLRYAAISLLR